MDYQARVHQIINNIETSDDIHPDTKDALKDFKTDRSLNDISFGTLKKDLTHLKMMFKEVGPNKSYEEVTSADTKQLVSSAKERGLARSTVETYKNAIKIFYQWSGVDDDEPPIGWITVSSSYQQDTLPQDLLTPEEVQELIEEARHPRDKALIAMLWETGARIGELIDIEVGDIEDREHGRKVVLSGKTGARRIPLRESVPHLTNWLTVHPDPSQDNPLWSKIRGEGAGTDQIRYQYVRLKILKRSAEEANIEKPVNPHHFRHSRATYLASRFTEHELCQWMGWSDPSTASKYVHLSGRDIDSAYNQLHGIVEEEDEEELENETQSCPRCGEVALPDDRFCSGCGFAFDPEDAEEIEEAKQRAVERLKETGEPELIEEALEALVEEKIDDELSG